MDKEQSNVTDLREELNKNMTYAVLPVTVFIGVEQFFGFFGNILILIVYCGRYKRTNFRCFVLSMALIDLTSCCTTLPGEIFSQLNWYTYQYDWICKVKSYFNVFTAWGSASILLILAIDRYRKICRPLRWQIQPANALKLCVCAFILSSLVSVPILIFWGKQEYIYEYNGHNITVSICEKSGKYAETVYPLVYIGSVYFLPVGSMIFVAGTLNFLTARRLFGHTLLVSSVEKYTRSHTAPSTVTSVTLTLDNHEQSNNPATVGTEQIDKGPSDGTGENNIELDLSKVYHPENSKRKLVKMPGIYRKRKTIIMLVLTSVFVVTMAVYVVLISLVAEPHGILKEMSNSTKVMFFFFLRLYFINCVINPILYGFMDPRFRSGLLSYVHKRQKANWMKPNSSHSSH